MSAACALSGTLRISLVNGFVPTVGNKFQIVACGSRTGAFGTILGRSINQNEHVSVAYSTSDVTLNVMSGP